MTAHQGFCDLCSEQTLIESALVAWVAPVFGKYESVDRCVDRVGCRSRIEARGEAWPVIDPKQEGARQHE